ncbi:SOS response-associated peptidase [Aquimarina sp. ERC-38]|uniref:SOS response-associated peptidase n=1 Tax=Aquimarina sp. ERC-38 TaxID=2949996 RepID=UPI002246D48F|nr:SOS response-associated peptidase family protein [Aquimarina sp. ERC-38]UZO81101.1 SOS response-associated peptidase [Aquimarina sp. ERC-38]
MYNKLSNTAEREVIEGELKIAFKFPNLYQPEVIIEGSDESILVVVTSDEPKVINYAIWGLLPANYKEEWSNFQSVFNSLTVDRDEVVSSALYKDSFYHRRCIVVITGFLISHLHDGIIHPYLVYHKEEKPFCVAGVYTTLEDGFITCSLVMKDSSHVVSKIQNLNKTMPIILNKSQQKKWLDKNTASRELLDLMDTGSDIKNFKAHPIAKEFIKNNISFESILEPVYYKGIPGDPMR